MTNECPEKCETCDEQSNRLNLCITCNTNADYYPVNYNNFHQIYSECMKYSTISQSSNLYNKFFFNPNTKIFNLCYETCKTCEISGDPANHNCLTCDADHIQIPNNYPLNNCITECKYYYYYTYFGQYKCTDYPKCPDIAKFFIKDKKKCIDDCLKDNDFKFQYDGNCLRECPEDTINDNNICKKRDPDICTLSENELDYTNFDNNELLESKVKAYSEEFSYTSKHISQYSNEDYNLIIFKNSICVTDLSIKISNVDFKDCYEKVKNFSNIDDDLIIAILDNYKNINTNKPVTSFSLFNPKTGQKLDAMTICMNDKVVVNKNFLSLLDEDDSNYEILTNLIGKGINIFDPQDDFYSDLCFYFISPIKKDIPLKDRLQEFYPNVTLCDSGCKNIGVNFTIKAAICECKFNDILSNNIANDIFGESISQLTSIINKSNIEVIKCLKYAFKYFGEKYGAIIVLSLFFASINFTIIFYLLNYQKIKLYIFHLTKNYISLISPNNQYVISPPKKVTFEEKSGNTASKRKLKFKNEKIDNLFTYKSISMSDEKMITKESNKKKEIKREVNLVIENPKKVMKIPMI